MISILNNSNNPSFAVPSNRSSSTSSSTSPPSRAVLSASRYAQSPESERAEHSDRDHSPLLLSPRRPSNLRANSSASSIHSTSSSLTSSNSSVSTMDGSSPITPGYQFDSFPSGHLAPLYETMEQDSAYPPLPEDLSMLETAQPHSKMMLGQTMTYSPLANNTQLPLTQLPQQIQPLTVPHAAPAPMDVPRAAPKPAANASSASTGKKNKYPCPFAATHSCDATFTTSGHAARHGKKHTGEKSVLCPVCNKAFTRKDNMKQHERTHKLSSSAAQASKEDSRKRKARRQASLSAKGRGSPSSATSELPQEQLAPAPVAPAAAPVQQALPIAPPVANAPMSAYPPLDDFQPRMPALDRYPSYGGGLDTLAMAASNVSSSPDY